jgi:hypothetical protein
MDRAGGSARVAVTLKRLRGGRQGEPCTQYHCFSTSGFSR